jgi:hypothetical protein
MIVHVIIWILSFALVGYSFYMLINENNNQDKKNE